MAVWPSFLEALGERASFWRLEEPGYAAGDVIVFRSDGREETRRVVSVEAKGGGWVELTVER